MRAKRFGRVVRAARHDTAPAVRRATTIPARRDTGTERARHAGQRLCSNKPVRMDRLDEAVWADVCDLLADPERLREEYTRRLSAPAPEAETLRSLESRVEQCQRRVSRLIDGYEHELLTRDEFESRAAPARRQLAEAESELHSWQEQTRDHEELQNVIGAFEEFRSRIEQGLSNPDAASRQAIVRALVKRVEIDGEQVRVVYRVHPTVPAPSRHESSGEPLPKGSHPPVPAARGEAAAPPETDANAPWLFPYCSTRQRFGRLSPENTEQPKTSNEATGLEQPKT